MPGYRALSSAVTGQVADSAREAELLRREGEPETAVLLLEEALAASRRTTVALPGWLCGRLAALYRTLGRHDDEVALLEHYRDSQSSDEARSRYDARLSKARTIAERKRRSESGALSSVRKVLGTARRRVRGGQPRITTPAGPLVEFQGEYVRQLGELLGERAADDLDDRVAAVIVRYCAEARANHTPVERLVEALRTASRAAATTHVSGAERDGRFSAALVRLLAAYFEDADR